MKIDNDISKCLGTNCSRKELCWRYVVKASGWQSYVVTPKNTKICKAFMPFAKRD